MSQTPTPNQERTTKPYIIPPPRYKLIESVSSSQKCYQCTACTLMFHTNTTTGEGLRWTLGYGAQVPQCPYC